MSESRDYIFECFMSINTFLNTVFKDIERENVELNKDVVEAIHDLEYEDFYNNVEYNVHIDNIKDKDEIEFVLNELIHQVYKNCELQKMIKQNIEIDNLVKEYEQNEQKCLDLKNRIVALHNQRL